MGRQRLTFLSDFIEAITRRTRSGEAEALRAFSRPPLERATVASSVLMGRIGDAARLAVAEQALSAYSELDEQDRHRFFEHLRDNYGVDADRIHQAYAAWQTDPDAANVAALFRAVEPSRQALLRRLNLSPGATLQIVRMRQDLLNALRRDPALAPIDDDFAHLLASWFNRGFLTMRRVDWNSSAAVLERIMSYESVHKMRGWDDLKRRLANSDRRIYAFFHPATGDEPLIFVEVALVTGIPDAIAPILTAPEQPQPVSADTAVFYSINNCLPGLKGISFGNFLIKQVVSVLAEECPDIRTFVTLSPVPGFAAWLARQTDAPAQELTAALSSGEWHDDPQMQDRLRPTVEKMAARYIVTERNRHGQPPDPVARFHLGNGASAHRLNWPGDMSQQALGTSHGLMVNYLYELEKIERRHEAFVRDVEVAHGKQLADALSRPDKPVTEEPPS